MNNTDHRCLRLAARNEGKIKSYESCVDVRAWSHDIRIRDRYLRDWIKCDMPICVVPVSTLSSVLSIMTCRSRGRVPRCHSGCQSKVLLDRLCSSCTVMKECLSNHKKFEKYFVEEDIETIHWPCEKCLEILKSIKMFWKIVIEKVLNINLPKSNESKYSHICSLQNLTKTWQKEMVEEAIFVKSNTFLSKHNIRMKSDWNKRSKDETKCNNYECRSKETETDCDYRNISVQTDRKYIRQKISKCTSASIKILNFECEPDDDKDNEVIMIYKNNIQSLQRQFDLQKNEVDRLKKENITLTDELQRFRQSNSNTSFNYDNNNKNNVVALITEPVEANEINVLNQAKDIESEMIITLKNCKNENFRHVSVIQVMHKTNELNLSEITGAYCKKEDPVHILNRVHDTFEAIVKREMSIASKTNKSFKNKNVVIKTTFRKVSESKSAPSCSTSSHSITSDSNFESANDTYSTSLRSGK